MVAALAASLATPAADALTIHSAVPAEQSGVAVISVARMFHATCAIVKGGRVKCWGRNQEGQLGQGHPVNLGDNPHEAGDYLRTVDLGAGVVAKSLAGGASHM